MKYIRKTEPPQELEEYKTTEGATFDKLDKEYSYIKRIVKDSLLAEQGYICCYCGKRINRENSMIEHFKPKGKGLYPELQLEYSNLLASCRGGSTERAAKIKFNQKKFPLSCDAKKENRVIEVSPTDPNCENFFAYDEDGEIYGLNSKANWAIEILGLNNEFLKNQRKAAIETYRNLPDETDWNEEIEFLSSLNKQGQYKPYCFVAINYIQHYKLDLVAA